MRNYEALSKDVNLLGVIKAAAVIGRYLNRTNLTYYSELSRLISCDVFVKHENHNPTGSFKIRGAVNFMASLSDEVREKGVIVATRGNHGLATAWAARNEGIFCNVVVPINNNPEINSVIKGLGAELMQHGKDFYETQVYCEELADEMGY